MEPLVEGPIPGIFIFSTENSGSRCPNFATSEDDGELFEPVVGAASGFLVKSNCGADAGPKSSFFPALFVDEKSNIGGLTAGGLNAKEKFDGVTKGARLSSGDDSWPVWPSFGGCRPLALLISSPWV